MLEQHVSLFLAEYKKTTAKAYAAVLLPFMRWIGTERPLDAISNVDVHRYVSLKLKTLNLAPATYRKHIKSLKTFFNWCVRLGLIPRSPAGTLKTPTVPKDDDRRHKAMNDHELEQIKKFFWKRPRNYALLMFIADTGCRAGGAATLRLDNLDLEGLSAKVTEKGEKTRKVWYSEQTAQALREWLIQRHAPDNPYVFPGRVDGHIKSDSVSQTIRRALVKTGCRSLGAHALRHRKGHQLSDQGTSAVIASRILGHSDVKITLDYYYADDDERAEQAVRSTFDESETETKIVLLKRLK